MDENRLGKILISQGVITPSQLTEALAEQRRTGRFIGEILVGRGAASE